MLAEKVEYEQREVVRALIAIRASVLFAIDYEELTGGVSCDVWDGIKALDEFEARLGRLTAGLRKLENAS